MRNGLIFGFLVILTGYGCTQSSEVPSNVPACTTGALFTVSPMDISKISTTLGINRLGNFNPPDHTFPTDHLYFYIQDSNADVSGVDNTALIAPGNIVVASVTSSSNETTGKTDYGITYYPCNRVQGTFAHVATLSDKLSSAFNAVSGGCTTYNPGSGNYTRCERAVNVTFAAGEEMGTVGGPTTASYALDVGLYDARMTPLVFANAARLTAKANGFDAFHVACFLDYVADDVKTALQEKIHRAPGEASTCGSYAQDVAATAQGKWYLAGTATPAPSAESNHLTLGKDTYDETLRVFSVGNATVGTGTYTFAPTHSGTTNRDFAEVTANGSVYCYDTLSTAGVIFLIQMPTTTTLKIEKQVVADCSGSPSFTSAATSFAR